MPKLIINKSITTLKFLNKCRKWFFLFLIASFKIVAVDMICQYAIQIYKILSEKLIGTIINN